MAFPAFFDTCALYGSTLNDLQPQQASIIASRVRGEFVASST